MKNQSHAHKLLDTYTATYLKEEILAETLTRDVHGFSHFLNIVSENSGLFLDFSKLANKSRVNRVGPLLTIYSNSLLLNWLENLSKN